MSSSRMLWTTSRRGNNELKLSAGSLHSYRCRQNHFIFVPTKYYLKENDGEKLNRMISLSIYKNVKATRATDFCCE